MKEEWRAVPGYGEFEVSNQGRVRSLDRVVRYTDGRVRLYLGQIYKLQKGNTGYVCVMLHHSGKKKSSLKNRTIHSLVLEAFVSSRPAGMQCRHLDGNKTNNRLDNLRWGTPVENQRDRITHGTDQRGEKSSGAKLTEVQVRGIRAKYSAGGCSHADLAREYGIGVANIGMVLNRKTWKHVA